MADANAHFDFAGLAGFRKIAEALEADLQPSPEAWEGLFATPGYAALTKSEFSRREMAENFRVALSPALGAEREVALAREEPRMVVNVVEARRRWAEVERLQEHLRVTPLESPAVRLARGLLPPAARPATDPPDAPPVAFVVFEKDGRGYVPVVLDALAAIEAGETLVLLLAHEFHHYYRNELLVFDPAKVAPEDEDIVWIVNQIHGEGLADLLNVPATIYTDDPGARSPWAADYRRAVEDAPEFLAQLGEILAGGCEPAQCRRLRREMLWSGHPVGYHMASFLAGRGLETELAAGAGDPWAFFVLFDREARRTGQLGFPAGAMAALTNLAARYAPGQHTPGRVRRGS